MDNNYEEHHVNGQQTHTNNAQCWCHTITSWYQVINNYEISTTRNNGTRISALRDIMILRDQLNQYNHPNIAEFISYHEECNPDRLYLHMPSSVYTLRQFIHLKDQVFNRQTRDNICSVDYFLSFKLYEELLQGLSFLHNKNLIIRNIRPENILVGINNGDRFLKITSFGQSVMTAEALRPIDDWSDIDVIYVAPEVLTGRQFDQRADIYSLATISQIDFFNIDFYEQQISFTSPLIDRNIIDELFNSLMLCLTFPDWDLRPSADQMIAYLNEFELNNQQFLL
ncbi:uncharacterized protein LOC128964027 [Oppia nitens]|uniref:uncharacterized protein LOC128964027 n=1 Tax=Oppia nitens TaxID=1686743 RepID=UPI0023DC206B|nr:uncharacterized protein LOC128964027 [Oppia nitens]